MVPTYLMILLILLMKKSAYSTLLMHVPWPSDGEIDLLLGFSTAIDALRSKIHELPHYAKQTISEV